MTAADDLLRWASEQGSGRWSQLREAAAYLTRTHELEIKPWQLAVPLASLGHLDIDWDEQCWSVAAPALALSPGMGLCIYLVGARSTRILERFCEATDDLDVYPFSLHQSNASAAIPAPTAMFAKCAKVETAQNVAERLGVPLVYDPARRIVEELPETSLDAAGRASPIPLEDGLERFDPSDGRWQQVLERDQQGLYRVDLYGRSMHRLHQGDNWYRVDKSTGQILVLQGRNDLLHWCKASPDFRVPPTLEVVDWLALPPLAERAAVVSSGFMPIYRKNRRIYRNVTRLVAEKIAQRLGLRLDVEKRPSSRLAVHSGGSRR